MQNEHLLKNRLIVTEDGSHTVLSEAFKCSYHSLKGAIQESRHIYIQNGLDFLIDKTGCNKVSILEYGFGTGLNAILACKYAQESKVYIDYESIEAFPLDPKTLLELNYSSILGIDESLIQQFHNANIPIQHGTFFKLKLHLTKFEEFKSDRKYDIIFFDAFGPDDQPHLWERPFLDPLSDLTQKGSILVTYSVKGSFKRALKSLGFGVEKLPGPPGKREVLRATKI